MCPASPVVFVTLGMFIIDEIDHHAANSPRGINLMGGAGTYAALGATLCAPSPNMVSFIVDAGSDFPARMRTELESWGTSCLFREDPSRITTRAWNGYDEAGVRRFKYLTPKLRLTEWDLSREMLAARAFHLVCSPSRAVELVEGIRARRSAEFGEVCSRMTPLFVWEPIPDLCLPEELENLEKAVRMVDVVSPNSAELVAFSRSAGGEEEKIAEMVKLIMVWGVGQHGNGSLVVRKGSLGSTAYGRQSQVDVPAYHGPDASSQRRVVDPTGGGNAFLGGLAMALASTARVATAEVPTSNADLREVLAIASVAASFCIEQAGMPCRSEDGLWNGEAFVARFREYARENKMLTRRYGL